MDKELKKLNRMRRRKHQKIRFAVAIGSAAILVGGTVGVVVSNGSNIEKPAVNELASNDANANEDIKITPIATLDVATDKIEDNVTDSDTAVKDNSTESSPAPTSTPEATPISTPVVNDGPKDYKPEGKIYGVAPQGEKYTYDARRVAKLLKGDVLPDDDEHIVFLTFDDGSSTTVTPQILKVLEEKGVKATFFLTGKNIEGGGEEARKLVKKEYDMGMALANHSYSHDYSILYPGRSLNLDNFKADFEKTDKILKDIIGDDFETKVIRCPGGYMSWNNMAPLDQYMEEQNMAAIDWNALNQDAEGGKKTADQLVQSAIKTAGNKHIIVLLMHDTYGKEETAKALPQIIDHFKNAGYEFRTLA